MSGRSHIDSNAERSRLAAEAAKKITSPLPLTEQGRVFFEEIITEKAKAEWTDHEISLAALLARLMADVAADPEQKQLVQKMNQVIATRRSLGLHSSAAGENHVQQKRRKMAKQIENEILSATDDDLIAKPAAWN